MSEQAQAAPAAQPAASEAAPQKSTQLAQGEQAPQQADISQGEGQATQAEAQQMKSDIEQAVADGASEEQIQDMIREFELKVNGKKIKKKLDLSDEDAIKRELQLAAAGREAMQKTKELEKLYTSELERLKQNPWEVLQELGLNPDDLAYSRLEELVKEQEKSPEQREREQMQKELEAARKREKEREDELKRIRSEQMIKEQEAQLENEIESALSKNPDLPKSPKTVMKIADALSWAMENGYTDATVEDVIPAVRAEIEREFSDFFANADDKLFEKYVGKKNLERYRKSRLKSMKTSSAKEIKPTVNDEQLKKDEQPRKKIRSKDFFKDPTKFLEKVRK